MKKRTFLLFGLLAMLVLTACGGKSGAQTSTDDATDTSDNSQQTTAEETARRCSAYLGSELYRPCKRRFLRRTDLSPHYYRLYDAGRRPAGQRHRRLGEHYQGRVLGERRGEQAVAHARCGFDGTLKRPGQRILAVLHRSAGQHLSRRSVRLLRLCDQGHGCCG